jgi:hypothetical protein
MVGYEPDSDTHPTPDPRPVLKSIGSGTLMDVGIYRYICTGTDTLLSSAHSYAYPGTGASFRKTAFSLKYVIVIPPKFLGGMSEI